MIRDLPESSERERALQTENTFTFFVDLLRNSPDPDIQEMGRYAWQVIEHSYVITAIHPVISTLTMAILQEQGISQSYIFIPQNWLDQANADPVRQLGAVAFVCSQAADAYNDVKLPHMRERAMAYEGVVLSRLQPMLPNTWQPDAWQLKAMSAPPVSIFAYSRKPVVPPS